MRCQSKTEFNLLSLDRLCRILTSARGVATRSETGTWGEMLLLQRKETTAFLVIKNTMRPAVPCLHFHCSRGRQATDHWRNCMRICVQHWSKEIWMQQHCPTSLGLAQSSSDLKMSAAENRWNFQYSQYPGPLCHSTAQSPLLCLLGITVSSIYCIQFKFCHHTHIQDCVHTRSFCSLG